MRPGIWQVVIVLIVLVVLFGAKKVPELARALGKAKGEFKKGLAEGEKLEAEAEDAKTGEKPREIPEAK
jgi:sec-independent protein translocase protein TatA